MNHFECCIDEPPFYCCCCKCINHFPVMSHPWHDGKTISNINSYVCVVTDLSGGHNIEKIFMNSDHSIGCELFRATDPLWYLNHRELKRQEEEENGKIRMSKM
jgi:hypothetical protein